MDNGRTSIAVISQCVCIYNFMLSMFRVCLLITPQPCSQRSGKAVFLCKLASPLLIPKKIAAMPRDKSHERSLENGPFGKPQN